MSEFGDFVREARAKAGVPLRELADAVGISAPQLSRVERGQRPPPMPDVVAKVAAELGVDPKPILELAWEGRREALARSATISVVGLSPKSINLVRRVVRLVEDKGTTYNTLAGLEVAVSAAEDGGVVPPGAKAEAQAAAPPAAMFPWHIAALEDSRLAIKRKDGDTGNNDPDNLAVNLGDTEGLYYCNKSEKYDAMADRVLEHYRETTEPRPVDMSLREFMWLVHDTDTTLGVSWYEILGYLSNRGELEVVPAAHESGDDLVGWTS